MVQPDTLTSTTGSEAERSSIAIGWLVLLASILLPFLLLAAYNYPSIHDDYSNANRLLKFGPVSFMQNLYLHWTGRYSEVFLKAYLNPLTYQHTALLARLQPVIVIGLLVAGFYAFFAALLKRVHISLLLANALIATTLYLNGFEVVGAAIYWFGGYTSYTAGVIASLFAFASMLALLRANGFATRIGLFLIASFFSIVAIGAYDVSMMAIVWVVSSATVVSWWGKHSIRWWYTLLLVLVLVSVYFSMSAPGNQERALQAGRNISQVVKSPRVVVLMFKSIYFAVTQSIAWVNSLVLILGTFLIIGLLLRVPNALQIDLNSTSLVVLIIWMIAGLSATVFPSVLVYQTVWGHSWQCVYIYFILAWGWLVLLIVGRYRTHVSWLLTLGSGRSWGGLVLLFSGLCLLGSESNTHLAYLDLATNAPKYYVRLQQREQAMQAAATRHAKAVELYPLYAYDDKWMIPKGLYTNGFSLEDARQYVNFHGIDSVVVRPLPYNP